MNAVAYLIVAAFLIAAVVCAIHAYLPEMNRGHAKADERALLKQQRAAARTARALARPSLDDRDHRNGGSSLRGA